MDPHQQFCPNSACPASGQLGQGNITIHSQAKARYRCSLCKKTFSARSGTPFYRQHTDAALIALIIVLLTHGCPIEAIVAAWGFQARTVRRWANSAGRHAQAVHEQLVMQPREHTQVQADEIRAKTQSGVVWLGMAVAVPTRLWLGGVVGRVRDKHLIRRLLDMVVRCVQEGPLLFVSDGFSSYVGAAKRAFRRPERVAPRGRPRLVQWPGLVIGQVVKYYQRRHVTEIERRLVVGENEELAELLASSQGGGVLNTSYIERLNGTFRQYLAALGRKSRNLARLEGTLLRGMYLVGTIYNFCCSHESLSTSSAQRTPAMAAGITDHAWSVAELLWYKVPPPRWQPPKQRGRRSKDLQAVIDRWLT